MDEAVEEDESVDEGKCECECEAGDVDDVVDDVDEVSVALLFADADELIAEVGDIDGDEFGIGETVVTLSGVSCCVREEVSHSVLIFDNNEV